MLLRWLVMDTLDIAFDFPIKLACKVLGNEAFAFAFRANPGGSLGIFHACFTVRAYTHDCNLL